MLQIRTKSVLAVGALAMLLVGPLQAQDLEGVQLFAPADLSTYGGQPQAHEGFFFGFDGLLWSIAQPERTPIGYPGMRLTFRPPLLDDATRAYTPDVQTNSMDTGQMNAGKTPGNRIQFGRVYGRDGWMFSTYRLNDQVQRFSDQDVEMVFLDVESIRGNRHLQGWMANMVGYDAPPPGEFIEDATTGADYVAFAIEDLPITFDEVLVENRVETWDVELMYIRRSGPGNGGGLFEFLVGVRYLEFNERFRVQARGNEVFNDDATPASVDGVANWRFMFDLGPDGDPTATNWSPIGPGNVLADSFWLTEAQNHIVGPQIGGRWSRQSGALTLSVEGHFLAGLNMQNIRNRGVLGSELGEGVPYAFDSLVLPLSQRMVGYPYVPLLRQPYSFDHAAHLSQWSPGGDLRLELALALTQAVSVKVGWSGMWLGGIARASAMPDYIISDASVMDINRSKNNQGVFVNGLNVGLSINR
jgi:hypothetical protein